MRPLRNACWIGSVTWSWPTTSANEAGRDLRYNARDNRTTPTTGRKPPASDKGPLAPPPEPAYPCCLPALGELGGITPHEGSSATLAGVGEDRRPSPHRTALTRLDAGGFA